ncbi:MAG: LCP family protein [Clostridiales bacterium]|nr:LCP family protein [Clostridiales bacterium]
MSENDIKTNGGEKKRFIKKYFIILSVIMGCFAIFFGLGVSVYMVIDGNEILYSAGNQVRDWRRATKISEKEGDGKENEEEISVPLRTNFLLIGRDEIAGLTDTIIAGNLKADTGEVSLISIPRDLYTTLERDKINELKEFDRYPPSYFKLNSLYNYVGGGERGIKYLKDEVSDIIGAEIDYYIMIDTSGLRSVVDAIGGIDIEVPETPEGGLYYNDPAQDLYINLKSGMQHLNGKQAEGLVRFRKGYASQDIKRMEVQQEFLKVFLKTVLSSETLKNNLSGLASDFMRYVETDITLGDVAKYLPVISQIDPNKVKSTVLPSDHKPIRGSSAYYFEINEEEARDVIDEYFFGIAENGGEETTAAADEK